MPDASAGFDTIIVGGGAAGCVLAARLSEDPARRVALLEAGGESRSPLLRVPGLSPFASRSAALTWRYAAEPEEALRSRAWVLLGGRVLGGSSRINGLVYTRGHARNYDAWRDTGCEDWGGADVLPFFRRAELNERGELEWHGADGPLRVRRSRPVSPLPAMFLDAAAAAGFAVADDLNTDVVDAFGLTDICVGDGLRSDTLGAYLEPARQRRNLTVLTHARVVGIEIIAGRAVGVRVRRAGEAFSLRAEREVVLAAGGIGSPHILLLSGIGPADALRRVGIPVVHDLPGVGQNLQNHPSVPLRYATELPVSLAREARGLGAARTALTYALGRRGAAGDGIFQVAGFVRTDAALEVPDAQIVMSPLLLPPPTARGLGLLPRLHGLTLAVQQGTPWSRGEVCLATADPEQLPRIRTGALGDPRDLAVMEKAVMLARRVMSQPPMRSFRPHVVAGDGTEHLDIRATAMTAYHQSGTCSMGAPGSGVVDAALRVHGIEALRIADSSVIPLIPNAALHAPTVMTAERAAALIAS